MVSLLKIMNIEFENRWHDKHEILKSFRIRNKTWNNWLYDTKTCKKKDLSKMGVYKLPDTNYYVINPFEFRDWFNKRIGVEHD